MWDWIQCLRKFLLCNTTCHSNKTEVLSIADQNNREETRQLKLDLCFSKANMHDGCSDHGCFIYFCAYNLYFVYFFCLCCKLLRINLQIWVHHFTSAKFCMISVDTTQSGSLPEMSCYPSQPLGCQTHAEAATVWSLKVTFTAPALILHTAAHTASNLFGWLKQKFKLNSKLELSIYL